MKDWKRGTNPHSPFTWVPTLYIAEGVPYIIAMTVSVVLYKNLGISNRDIALYTGAFYLPWVIKPLWSPLIDLLLTRRSWVLKTEFFITLTLLAVALSIPSASFFPITLFFFWLMAFSSATHDTAADGFYLLGLKTHEQAAFVGVRTAFYRVATIAAKGGVVITAGFLEAKGIPSPTAWSLVFYGIALFFLLLFCYHYFILPYPRGDERRFHSQVRFFSQFFDAFASFFRKKGILTFIAFFLLYRFAEAQLVKMVAPFLLDPPSRGGLGLTTAQVGFAYGTVGVTALMLGGLLGGYAVYRKGLKYWLWIMVSAMHVPDLIFLYFAYALPQNLLLISFGIAIEQFGYGFGFTAFTMVMLLVAKGEYQTVHYAIATGIMAFGMMIPAMISGYLQELLGYKHFFLWVILATIPGFVVTGLVKVEPHFGKKIERHDR